MRRLAALEARTRRYGAAYGSATLEGERAVWRGALVRSIERTAKKRAKLLDKARDR